MSKTQAKKTFSRNFHSEAAALVAVLETRLRAGTLDRNDWELIHDQIRQLKRIAEHAIGAFSE